MARLRGLRTARRKVLFIFFLLQEPLGIELARCFELRIGAHERSQVLPNQDTPMNRRFRQCLQNGDKGVGECLAMKSKTQGSLACRVNGPFKRGMFLTTSFPSLLPHFAHASYHMARGRVKSQLLTLDSAHQASLERQGTAGCRSAPRQGGCVIRELGADGDLVSRLELPLGADLNRLRAEHGALQHRAGDAAGGASGTNSQPIHFRHS